ncbi:hypothetical protein ES703_87266 [subsurface metagenome]
MNIIKNIVISDKIVRKNVFEELGAWAINRALMHSSLVIMAELGRFEINCEKFTRAVKRAFDIDLPLIASVKNEKNPFINLISQRKDIRLFEINPIATTGRGWLRPPYYPLF